MTAKLCISNNAQCLLTGGFENGSHETIGSIRFVYRKFANNFACSTYKRKT